MESLRHPFIPIATAFAAGIALGSFACAPAFYLVAAPLAVGLGTVVALRGRTKLPLGALLAAILLVGAAWGSLASRPRPGWLISRIGDGPALARLRVKVVDVPLPPHPAGHAARAAPATVKLSAVECGTTWLGVSGRALLWISGHHGLGPGDHLELLCTARRPNPARAPGAYDRRDTLAREAIWLELTAPDATVKVLSQGSKFAPARVAWRVRLRLAEAARSNLPPDESELLIGLLLGYRSGIDPALRDRFAQSGLGHVLVVSGLHLALLAGLAGWLLRRTGLSERATALTLICLAAFYATLTGMRPSVLRAGAMTSAHLAATVFGRDRNAKNSLALAAFLLLLWRPLWLFDPGFQLSFAAVSFLVFLYPLLEQMWTAKDEIKLVSEASSKSYFERAISALRRAFFVSLAAWAGVEPLLLHHVGFINPWAVFSNLVGLPIAAIALGAGATFFAAAGVWSGFSSILTPFTKLTLWALLAASDAFSRLPFGTVRLPSPGWLWLASYYGLAGVLFGWSNLRSRNGNTAKTVAGCIVLAAVAVTGPILALAIKPRPHAPSVTVLDVGDTCASLVRTHSHAGILVNAGSAGRGDGLVKQLLRTGQGPLAMVFLTSCKGLCSSGLPAVLEGLGAEILAFGDSGVWPEGLHEAIAQAESHGTPVLRLDSGDELSSRTSERITWLSYGGFTLLTIDTGGNFRVVFVDSSLGRKTYDLVTEDTPTAEWVCDVAVICGAADGSATKRLASMLKPRIALNASAETERATASLSYLMGALAERGAQVLHAACEGSLRVRPDGDRLLVERWDGSAWVFKLSVERIHLGRSTRPTDVANSPTR